jgi:hypothetical protein
LEVTDLDTQFHDGVYLTLLMGLLEGYFIPLHEFFLTPKDFDQKVHNVAFAFELMQDSGLPKPKARPEGNVPLFLGNGMKTGKNNFYSFYRYCKFGPQVNSPRSLQSLYQIQACQLMCLSSWKETRKSAKF